MRVAMYYNNNDVRVEEMPIPLIDSNEILVKIKDSGICGSDVMEWYRIKKAPLVLGHEIAGTITETGKNVKNFKKGDRVFVSHHIPCNTCNYCLKGHYSACNTLRTTNFYPGGFAEYIRAPAINVDRGTYILPDEISFEEGTFIEPLACVLRGQKLARLQPGQQVLVIGSGISGLLHIQLARSLGAGRITATDMNEYRLNAALKFGAEKIIHADEDVAAKLKSFNNGLLADLVIVCTGNVAAIAQALKSVERGGTILFFAPSAPDVTIPLPLNEFWRDEITVTTSYAASPSDILGAIELLRNRRVLVKEMITHRLGLEETGLGFQLVANPQNSIKVIIEPQR